MKDLDKTHDLGFLIDLIDAGKMPKCEKKNIQRAIILQDAIKRQIESGGCDCLGCPFFEIKEVCKISNSTLSAKEEGGYKRSEFCQEITK
jgi:hypothetical protein